VGKLESVFSRFVLMHIPVL